MSQPETGNVKTSEDESVEFETLSDDEEITIPSQDRDREISDVRNIYIRDEQLENTQREDWLLPTEPMHGARPRQTGRERPPVIDNPALRDAEEIAVDRDAAEISAIRHPSESHPPFVVRTADFYGRGSIHTAEGGRLAPEPQGVPREVQAVPKIFPEDSLRDGGQGQKNVGSPMDTLVNTVSHMQKDLAILREENRVLRTPATSQVIQAPRQAALTTTKVLRFDGITSWEQYQCLR